MTPVRSRIVASLITTLILAGLFVWMAGVGEAKMGLQVQDIGLGSGAGGTFPEAPLGIDYDGTWAVYTSTWSSYTTAWE
jgi:hypothetical protein